MKTSRRTNTFLIFVAAVAVGGVVTWLWYQARHSEDAIETAGRDTGSPGIAVDEGARGESLDADSEQSVVGIAARVGSVNITVAEVDAELRRARRSALQRGQVVDWDWLESRRAEIVERRIRQVALFEHAEQQGVEVTASEVDEAVKVAVVERFGDIQTFEKWLGRREMSEEDFARRIEEQLIEEKLLAEAGIPEPDEGTLRRLYQQKRQVLQAPPRVRLDLVTMLSRPHAHGGQRRAQLARAREVASELAGGDWPEESGELRIQKDEWVMVPTLPEELQSALRNVASQQVGGPVQSPDGLHVFRVHEYRPGGSLSFEEVRETLRGQAVEEARAAKLNSLTKEGLSRLTILRLDQHWYRRALRRERFRRSVDAE